MKWFVDYNKEKFFMDLNMYKLRMNEFYITVNNNLTRNDTYLYSLHKYCIECPYTRSIRLSHRNSNESTPARTTEQFLINRKFIIASGNPDIYLLQNQTETGICDVGNNFGQFGVYNVDINEEGCSVNVLKEPVNVYTPMVTVLLIYLLSFLIIYGGVIAWKKWNYKKERENIEEIPKKNRIKSLDTFRGFSSITIVFMIFCNYGGGGYSLMHHTIWNGLHVADLVFPYFVWIMGVCIPISLTANFKRGLSNRTIFLNILKRSVILYCLGLFLGSGDHYIRVLGVLQRLAICYLVASTICLFCMKRSTDEKLAEKWKGIEDIIILAKCWILALTILLLHTLIIFSVAAPGCPKGYFGPGGLHKNRLFVKCVGGASGYIDTLVLGKYRHQYARIEVYTSAIYEHAGIVGTLTAIVHTFLGVQAGVTLKVYKSHSQRILRWLSWAVTCGLAGGGLCGFSKEGGIIPVNWNLWSFSFVLVTSCFAFVLLSVCYVLVDVKRYWSGKPFLFVGMNSILVYVGHLVASGKFPFRWYMPNEEEVSRGSHFEALLTDIWAVGVWVLVAYGLYKKRCFLSV